MIEEDIYIDIDDEFPNALFSVCVDDLDVVFDNNDTIILKYKYSCYCYSHTSRQTEYFVIKNDGEGITMRKCINKLIEYGFDTDCNHRFFEGLAINTYIQYEIFMGS